MTVECSSFRPFGLFKKQYNLVVSPFCAIMSDQFRLFKAVGAQAVGPGISAEEKKGRRKEECRVHPPMLNAAVPVGTISSIVGLLGSLPGIILVGLRYLSKGDFLSETADLHGISKTTASLAVADFVNAVNRRINNIRFPLQRDELDIMKLHFFRKCGIPNVVGAVDGTLVPISAPFQDPEVFMCRKGFYALNVQAVVDSEMRFTDVVCKWPGSQHDSAIFDSCALKTYLEENNIGHLLGDSGYPLKTYLLTPVIQPENAQQDAYNVAHSKGRRVVECAFGVLKARFRCLHRSGGCLPFSPGKCSQTVMACMRLHNMCIDAGVDIELPYPTDDETDDESTTCCNFPSSDNAITHRRNIIHTI